VQEWEEHVRALGELRVRMRCGLCFRTRPRKGSGLSAMARCGGCKAVRYCSPQCQQEHWRAGHKKACGK
jgi:hypothetical protein